jgi:hypothetical protein
VFLDAPRPLPFGQDKLDVSHNADGLIGSMTHHNPYNHPSPTYGENPYPQPYGGATYYPPAPHLQSYPVGHSQPLGAPPQVPMMHPISQFSTSSPSTPTYNPNNGGSTSTSYTLYGSSPQNNPYFPFPSPPQQVSPPPRQSHVCVNFVYPSPIQQVQIFEQLNMKNLAHPLNSAKKKGKNRNKNNLGPRGNNPQQNHHAGGNQNQGNQNPQGGNNNNPPRQGRNNNLRTNFPYDLCGEYVHYTHHYLQIVDFKWMKASMNPQCPLALLAPQQAPQHYLQPPPAVLQNPTPH